MMKKGENTNHPKVGDKLKVEPIRDLRDIESIKKLLSGNQRNLLLFTLGINNGLRCGDILQIKVGDVRNLKVNDTLTIREQKTGKENVLMVNKSVHKVLHQYLKENPYFKDDDYLFQSKKGKNEPLTVSTVNTLVKSWCKSINLKGQYGTHSLRKTFGFIQRVYFKVGIEILMKRFNHSSPSLTTLYIGIQDTEINNILMNEI